MPIPAGLDVAYVYCVAWVLVGVTFLGVLHPLASAESTKDRTRVRTYARLLALNEWLNRLLDRTWDHFPVDTIPDADTLFALRVEVNRAYAVQHTLDRRGFVIEVGRLLAALHVVAGVLAGVALWSGVDRSILRAFGVPVFLGGVVLVTLVVVVAIVCSVSIHRGSDL